MNIRHLKSMTAALAAATLAYSSLTAAAPPTVSKEQREKMAQAHDNVAQCLRSDRPIAECRQEMMRASNAMMGEHDCKMMMDGKGMKGKQADPATEADAPKR